MSETQPIERQVTYHEKRAQKVEEEFQIFKEEREFFRGFGWSDRQIAARLGIEWQAYRRRFLRRSDELGEIVDPDESSRRRWTEFLASVKSSTQVRKRN